MALISHDGTTVSWPFLSENGRTVYLEIVYGLSENVTVEELVVLTFSSRHQIILPFF